MSTIPFKFWWENRCSLLVLNLLGKFDCITQKPGTQLSLRNYIKYKGQCFIICDIQTPRREFKIWRTLEYFGRNLRCLDRKWNTISSIWYIFSKGNKNKEVNREEQQLLFSVYLLLSKFILIKTGYPNLLYGCSFFLF